MRIRSLVKAQLIETQRNPTLLMLPVVIICLVIVWSMIPGDESKAFFPAATMVMVAYMVALQVPVLSLSEDKEKRTLEAVLLTPASAVEVIGAKVIVGTILSVGTAVIALAIYQKLPVNPFLFVVGFGLALILTMSLGTVIGLIANDQKSAGVISAVVMLIMGTGSAMPWEHISPAAWSVMRWLPTRPVLELLLEAMTGEKTGTPAWQSVLVMLPYVALAFFISVRQIRRQASAR